MSWVGDRKLFMVNHPMKDTWVHNRFCCHQKRFTKIITLSLKVKFEKTLFAACNQLKFLCDNHTMKRMLNKNMSFWIRFLQY